MPSTSPCSLRLNPITNLKGGVVSEVPAAGNKYNHNFQNRFCGCECDYDAEQQKGTMFQCLGLGTLAEGGCGEDWWHAACVVGLDPSWHENQRTPKKKLDKPIHGLLDAIAENESGEGLGAHPNNEDGITSTGGVLSTIGVVESEDVGDSASANGDGEDSDDDELPPPPGFPHEDDFEGFICYKCVDANPWIKRYAGAKGFLEPVFKRSAAPSPEAQSELKPYSTEDQSAIETLPILTTESKKRKSGEDEVEDSGRTKRLKDDLDLDSKSTVTQPESTLDKSESASTVDGTSSTCKYELLPPSPPGTVSLFFKSDFREHLCRCADCFPKVAKYPHLLEEEDTYEPPVSEDGDDAGGSTVGSGSLLDRGERALTNVDRVRAIEGVMAYNHLKEKLTPFFKEFAESGKAISAEDIKAHFAKMRGDEQAIKDAGEAAASSESNRKEQSGY
jgi:E3 ubiquitin-protein ligase UBR7